MKCWLFFLSIIFIFPNCNNSDEQSSSAKDSVRNQVVIAAFNKDEKAAFDSISNLGLEPLYNSCLKYSYVLYGRERLAYKNEKDSLTIGECNIRVIGFGSKSGKIKSMTFGVFFNDSIPADAVLQTSWGSMINTFDVDVEKKELLDGSTGGGGIVSISNIQALYDSAIVSNPLKNYLETYRDRIHPKFKKIINNQ